MSLSTELPLVTLRRKFQIANPLWRCVLAEYFCTTFLIFTGSSVTAQTFLTRFEMNGSVGLSIGWGVCLCFAVQMGFEISGSHLNPAISFFHWTIGLLPFSTVVLYSLAQLLASFTGAMLTFIYYYDKINQFDGGNRTVVGPNATAGIFATYPGDHLTVVGSVVDQICCTAIMCVIVASITDPRNNVPKWAQPAMIGVMLTTLCLGFGLNAGNGMNPARDLGPRIFTFFVGYGWEVFSFSEYSWWWVPVVCPMVGALLGSWLYQLVISINIPDEKVDTSLTLSQSDLLISLSRSNSKPFESA
jgi:aquaglyceroporin related protein